MEREENMVIDINMKDDIYPEDCVVNKENDEEIERAIDEIIKYDPLNIYKKVKREVVSTF